MMVRCWRTLLAAVCGVSALAASAQVAAQEFDFPEASSGLVEQKGGTAETFMVAAANPIAVQAGYDMLKDGGNALDAAFATQLVLNLVEPQSSGIGGGAFVLYWDNAAQRLYAYDGRETAPASATEDRFLTADGKAMRRGQAVIGGKSVGVPGLVRMMKLSHDRHGASDWSDLFTAAIGVAENGFAISPRLHRLLDLDETLPKIRIPAEHYYQADGTPKPVGTVLKNERMTTTLKRIATEGPRAFYTGDIAETIVARVRETTRNPADLTLDDLASYRAKERDPLCAPYRSYKVCGMPAPTSGGIGVIQTLGLLERFDLPAMDPWSAEAIHLFVEASRLVYADRAVHIADPDFVSVPQDGLVSPAYLAERSALIDPSARMNRVTAGEPPHKETLLYQPGIEFERPSTTHISVIDGDGNAASMTSSIEGAFGSHLMVRGFLLNNQLTDFTYDAVADGRTVANRVEGGKRPRSSMAPIIVFDADDEIVAVSGSPGGMAIVPLVAKTLIAMLDWNMTPQDATNLPNVLIFGPTVLLEGGTAIADFKEDLEAFGHRVRVGNFPSGVHALAVRDGVIWGGADPRREGTVMGD